MSETFEGHIVEFYRNCPKPDGWFGCRFFTEDSREVIDLKGIVLPVPKIGANIIVEAERVQKSHKYGGGYEYQIIHVTPAKDKKSVISYLCSLRGIGRTTAEKVWSAFHGQALDIIQNDPERLRKLGLPNEAVNFLINGVTSTETENLLRQNYLELKTGQIKKIIEFYHDGALSIMERDPYQLCVDLRGERGFDFASVDAVALAHGAVSDDPKRILAAVTGFLHKRLWDAGDMAVDLTDHMKFIGGLLNILNRPGITPVNQDAVISCILQESERPKGQFVIEQYDRAPLLYTREGLMTEKSAALSIQRLLKAKPLCREFVKTASVDAAILRFEKQFGISLDDSQKAAVRLCLSSRVSVLTGGPGTGKTATARCLAWCFKNLYHEGVICLAPTNLAVRRLRELVSECVKPEFGETTAKRVALGRAEFEKEKRRMDKHLVLVDETSMLSLSQAAGVLSQCEGAHVVFLGDADQLPSIDPGDFFADVIKSGAVPVARLNICHRAAGKMAILRNADFIRRGEIKFEKTAGIFDAIFPKTEPDTTRLLVDWYKSRLDAGFTPDKICILCPTRKRETGAVALNAVIRDVVNPLRAVSSKQDMDHRTPGMVITGSVCWTGDKRPSEFRIGDRVVNLVNRPGEGRVNGDVGYITSWYIPVNGTPTIGVTFDGFSEEIEIDVTDSEDLTLAYALTVHKSQGQEYSEVAVSLPSVLKHSPSGFASRNLLYTAVTRAKDAVFLCGDFEGYRTCVQNIRLPRLGRLQNRLLEP